MAKAREFARAKKQPQALMCLKKKKMYEQQLERLDALVSRWVDIGGSRGVNDLRVVAAGWTVAGVHLPAAMGLNTH
jgi:hypothetical protein